MEMFVLVGKMLGLTIAVALVLGVPAAAAVVIADALRMRRGK